MIANSKQLKNCIGFLLGISSNLTLTDKLTVFNFHDVSDSPSEFSLTYGLNVSPRLFEFQINFIRTNFNIISIDDLLSNKIPPKAALVTFDDGLKSFFTKAIPILQKLEVPVLIFLNMGAIRGEMFWSGLITYLSKKDKRFIDLLKSHKDIPEEEDIFLYCDKKFIEDYLDKIDYGIEKSVGQFVGPFANIEDLESADTKKGVFFGNHLYNHHVPLLMSNNELLDSYRENETCLKKFKSYRNAFSYPFGQSQSCFNFKQTELLFNAGARIICSADPLINRINKPYFLHRISLTSQDTTPSKIWLQIFRKTIANKKQFIPHLWSARKPLDN